MNQRELIELTKAPPAKKPKAGDTKWAWDSRPDKGPPRMVFVGNKDEWDINETARRKKGNKKPWGGVWTKPLVEGAKKARFGKADGRYLCCEDEECGVWVAVKQGRINAWHFARDWSMGTTSKHNRINRDVCVNKENYSGESRYHKRTKQQIYLYLKATRKLNGKDIIEVLPEKSVEVRQKDGSFERRTPDVFVKFSETEWLAIEVIYTHAPEEEAHLMYKTRMVAIDIKEYQEIDDSEFAKWIRNGGAEQALIREADPSMRKKKYEQRKRYWSAKAKRERIKANRDFVSDCFFEFNLKVEFTETELSQFSLGDIRERFIKEQSRLELNERIQKEIRRCKKKYDISIPGHFESVSAVTRAYSEAHKKRKSREEFISKCVEKFGFTIHHTLLPDDREGIERAFQEDYDKRREEVAAVLPRLEKEYGFSLEKTPMSAREARIFFKEKQRRIETDNSQKVIDAYSIEFGVDVAEVLGLDADSWTVEEIHDAMQEQDNILALKQNKNQQELTLSRNKEQREKMDNFEAEEMIQPSTENSEFNIEYRKSNSPTEQANEASVLLTDIIHEIVSEAKQTYWQDVIVPTSNQLFSSLPSGDRHRLEYQREQFAKIDDEDLLRKVLVGADIALRKSSSNEIPIEYRREFWSGMQQGWVDKLLILLGNENIIIAEEMYDMLIRSPSSFISLLRNTANEHQLYASWGEFPSVRIEVKTQLKSKKVPLLKWKKDANPFFRCFLKRFLSGEVIGI